MSKLSDAINETFDNIKSELRVANGYMDELKKEFDEFQAADKELDEIIERNKSLLGNAYKKPETT